MKILACVLLIFVAAAQAEFYWKLYKGVVPADAFVGGSDTDGKPTYIGLTFFPTKSWVLNTIIHNGNPTAYLIVGKEKWSNDKHNMILCTNTPELMKWIPTSTSKVSYLTGCTTVYAGGHGGEEFVARAFIEGRTINGRFVNNKAYVHDSAFQEKILDEFEILTYNCTNPWVEGISETN